MTATLPERKPDRPVERPGEKQPIEHTVVEIAPTPATDMRAKAFRALGDPVRLRIVELLLDAPEMTVGELTARLPVSQPRVSVHLKCLTGCGFTAVRRQGRNAFYRIANPRIVGIAAAMGDHADANREGILECMQCGPGRDGASCC